MVILAKCRKPDYVFEENDLKNADLLQIFMNFPEETVYITKENRLIGIVTLGDFKRNRFQKRELVQKNFTFLYEYESFKVEQLFEERENVHRIPIVDENGTLVKEYARELTIHMVNIIVNAIVVIRLKVLQTILKYMVLTKSLS